MKSWPVLPSTATPHGRLNWPASSPVEPHRQRGRLVGASTTTLRHSTSLSSSSFLFSFFSCCCCCWRSSSCCCMDVLLFFLLVLAKTTSRGHFLDLFGLKKKKKK